MADLFPNPKRQVQVFIELKEAHIPLWRLAQFPKQKLDRVHRAHGIENAPQHIGLFENVGRHQQLLLHARAGDIDRREHSLIRNLAIENNFRIAGSLEFFENHLVHARAGLNQRRGDDCQRSAFFDVSRRAEKAFRALERVSVDTTRQNLAR